MGKLTKNDNLVRPNEVQSSPTSERRNQEYPSVRIPVESVDRGHTWSGTGQRVDTNGEVLLTFRLLC